MFSIRVVDIFVDLNDVNKRYLNELIFADKCLKCLIEFKAFVDLIFNKIHYYLETNEISRFKKLNSKFKEILLG